MCLPVLSPPISRSLHKLSFFCHPYHPAFLLSVHLSPRASEQKEKEENSPMIHLPKRVHETSCCAFLLSKIERCRLKYLALHSIHTGSFLAGCCLEDRSKSVISFLRLGTHEPVYKPFLFGVIISCPASSVVLSLHPVFCWWQINGTFFLNSLHLVFYYRPRGPPPFNYSCWAQHYI